MLEGLEISIVDFSFVSESQDSRTDPSYYSKLYLNVMELVKHGESLGNISETYELHSNGAFADIFNILHKDSEREIRYIRSENVGNYFIEGETDYISKYAHINLPKTITQLGDILTARTGKVGGASVITSNWVNCNSNQNIVNIRIKDWNSVNPFYLTVFLNSVYGRAQFEKSSTGNVQPWLNLSLLRQIKIPILDKTFQEIIVSIFDTAYKIKQASQSSYEGAELILFKALELIDFKSSEESVNVKKLSESFGSSGRLDAEYYQKKYENYRTLIHSYPNGYETFSVACELKDKNFIPKDKIEYKYIELSNIGKSGEITDCTTALGEELPTRARRKVETNDVIISSIEGSLESCALVTSEYDNALCSTGFFIVNSKKLNSETLLVLFKSKPMQALLKKGCSGTILTAISKTELEQIPIPLIDIEIQNKIKALISESFEMRKESEHLLEVAKTAVEIAIEQDETTAIQYITESVNE